MVFVAEFKWGRYTPPRRASGNSVTNAAGSA